MMNNFGKILAAFAISMIFLENVDSSPNDTSGTCPSVFSCANCTAVRICRPNPFGSGFLDYKTANCTGSTPYCDPTTGTCTATPTKECSETGEMICLQDGTFPHPTDCSKYFNCANLQSYTVTCTSSYYDINTEKCATGRGCYRFNCYYYNGYKVAYPLDRSIYTYCVNNVATIVDRCYGKDELNTTTQQCEPVCRNEGFIPDTTDCTKYYRCNAPPVKGGQLLMTPLQCPEGQAFSDYEFTCLPIAQVASCNRNISSSDLLVTRVTSGPTLFVSTE